MGVMYENYLRMGVRVFLCTQYPLESLDGGELLVEFL